MELKGTLESFFRSYGNAYTIDGEGITRWGVLSRAKDTEPPKAEAESLGLGSTGSLRLMTGTEARLLCKGASLTLSGERYFVEYADDYRLSELPLYRQARLRRLRNRTEEPAETH